MIQLLAYVRLCSASGWLHQGSLPQRQRELLSCCPYCACAYFSATYQRTHNAGAGEEGLVSLLLRLLKKEMGYTKKRALVLTALSGSSCTTSSSKSLELVDVVRRSHATNSHATSTPTTVQLVLNQLEI